MGFFDLNIPYYESDKHIADKAARKTTRLKLVVKTMELGYTGVAYNRTIKGVMSESDRCATPRFPLSSVLKLAPSLSAAVKFHRGLLNVPLSAPFRQYTRLTVSVDSSSQASALNSGNPILKTYDIVAVRPLNQNAFEQACRASEVDLIAIDFSEKLPFRLKQPMVKAAIERGVYFEISYSGLIMDAQVRRQMISNAKLLVDWTRGKNLIFSSAAPSVTELRGPYDVANLSSLLGLHMEHAKAALSKNCRSLLANALRKKQYYKEAIRVEGISSGEQFDCKEPCFSEWLKWDPISSGEGDLLLDDMARSFSATNKVSKTVKAIDFASVMESLPSRGLHVQDLKSATEAAVQQLDIGKNLSVAAEEVVTQTAEEEPKNSVGLAVSFAPPETEMHKLPSQSHITSYDAHVMLQDRNATFRTSAMDTEIATFHTSAMDTEIAAACDAVTDAENSTPPKDIDFYAFRSEDFKRSSCSDVVLGTQDDVMEEVFIETDTKVKEDLSLTSYDVSLPEDLIEREKFRETRDDSVSREKLRETRDDSVSVADVLPIVEYCDKIEDNSDHLVANCEPPDEVAMEEQKQTEGHDEINCRALDDSSGRRKVKRRTPNQVFLSPFKRLLKPTPFKRKAQKSKTKARLL